jgi:hypothetical protein
VTRVIGRVNASLASAALIIAMAGCGRQKQPASTAPLLSPQDAQRAFQEMVQAMDNTLLEINELERSGGGLSNRIVLVEGPSLVTDDNRLQYIEALNRDAGRIRTLRASLQTSETVLDALTRNGHRLNEVIGIDAKPQGAVVIYFDPKTAY